MSDEKPLYSSERQEIVSPGFAQFCRDLRNSLLDDLYLKTDGSGLYLRAGSREVSLEYDPDSFNMVGGGTNTASLMAYFHPRHKETLIRAYFDLDPSHLSSASSLEIEAINHNLLSGRKGYSFVGGLIEPRRGQTMAKINQDDFNLPSDMPFFLPTSVPMIFEDGEIVFYFEQGTFREAVCTSDSGKTIYVPKQADR